jgi:hypothetical protein
MLDFRGFGMMSPEFSPKECPLTAVPPLGQMVGPTGATTRAHWAMTQDHQE